MIAEPTVFVIDPDEETCAAIEGLLRSVKVPVRAFNSAHEFLEQVNHTQPGCVVLEMRLPDMSGIALQQHISSWDVPCPVIIMTGHGDIPMVVEAMRYGAVDFLEKPFRQQVLLDRIYEALERDVSTRVAATRRFVLESRAALLTPRERQVMELVVHGLPNKAVAMRLGVTRKAVEAYRARVMRKMEAESLAELVRMNVVLEEARASRRPRRTQPARQTPPHIATESNSIGGRTTRLSTDGAMPRRELANRNNGNGQHRSLPSLATG